MSRYIVWIMILAFLVGCKLFGIGDGSVAKEVFWSGLALFSHWAYERIYS